ncbi:exo-beta-N-acetylmuramidase NamZ domain-containing protein [Alicyclobacillus shizuokensis]|uniref:exo-beta-N-acetylmuramidase NamZ domain-containing protein n=1 Tax=Alicyclobacillus shizuokensis TaxID=392014 RepID=UPI000830532B|nr:exo-beta-N-acetylmuramidase NamZ domain-containing protein [Alicyclobacillus shizuokensis]
MDASFGVEVLLSKRTDLLRDKQIGIVSNYATTERHFRPTINLLIEVTEWRVTTLLAPEHGLMGCAKEGEFVESQTDAHSGLTAYSLYGKHQRPTREMLANVDVLIIDLVDIGVRYYTNIGIAVNCLEACAELGLPVVVLDTPNPLNGVTREGNILSAPFVSLVGRLAIFKTWRNSTSILCSSISTRDCANVARFPTLLFSRI